MTTSCKNPPMWYKDAIIYELHVKSFRDSNGDGIGDFRGLIEKLDYLRDLGVTALWLLPFYPSPLRDDGYDIADYTTVHPDYGSLADFRRFLREAHARGLRVITELVINHTSDQHAWFQRARRAKPSSAWRDFYVWSDDPTRYAEARIIFQDFEQSNWTWDPVAQAYYWHRFYHHQPDLNFENPRVREQIFKVMDFWLDMGVDGLRLDAIPYLFEKEGTNCENLPETHEFLQQLRAHVDAKHDDRMLLAEANQWPDDAAAYFGKGNECHMAFHFPVMPRLYMSLRTEDRFPIVDMISQSADIPANCQWVMFLRNHDELTLEMVTDEERDYMYRAFAMAPEARINMGIRRRLAPLLENNRRRMELMNALLLSLPGTPVIYYGDEIGMGDNYYLGDRDGVRTPMQWSGDLNAGFSMSNPHRLFLPVVIDPEYHYTAVNVRRHEDSPSSLLWFMKRLIALRAQYAVFGRGSTVFPASDNAAVLSFVREHEGERILVVANLSRFSQAARIDLQDYAGMDLEDLFGGNGFPSVTTDPYVLTLGPHSFYWLAMKPSQAQLLSGNEELAMTLPVTWNELFRQPRQLNRIAPLLKAYIKRSRWFGGKGRTIRRVAIRDMAPVQAGREVFYLLRTEVTYAGHTPELYLLPVGFAQEEDAWRVRDEARQEVIAELTLSPGEGILYDATQSEAFREALLRLVAVGRRRRTSPLVPVRGDRLRGQTLPERSRVLRAEQSNTSLVYGESLFMKLYRRLDPGVNPDVEVSASLTRETAYTNFPPYNGSLEWHSKGEAPITIALLLGFVANENDAWTHMVHAAARFLDEAVPRVGDPLTGDIPSDPWQGVACQIPAALQDLIGPMYLHQASLLGRRTAELHLALASLTGTADVTPEPFSLLYQKSVYQSMRALTMRVFRQLRDSASTLPDDAQEPVSRVLALRDQILGRLRGMSQRKFAAMKIRIHGDYHLGQVLYTGDDFVIIDFEGEPARPLSERRLKRSALRDVAGMVRSFHYAAHTALRQDHMYGADTERLRVLAEQWFRCMSASFLDAYVTTVGTPDFLPADGADRKTLFDIFLLEKAIYEMGYEINNRPDWLAIPATGVLALMELNEERKQ